MNHAPNRGVIGKFNGGVHLAETKSCDRLAGLGLLTDNGAAQGHLDLAGCLGFGSPFGLSWLLGFFCHEIS
jgi:hypothetical protein